MVSEQRSQMQSSGASALEHTRTGPVYLPAVDIFETETSITVLADMPGVKPDQLEIDLRESVLTLTGRMTEIAAGSETDILHEYDAGTFFRQFTLAETIDQSKIEAKLTDGVLRLELPKVERVKPRRITVHAG